MPERLERCVRRVVGQGNDESSAYAICRSSLGLREDGSEDDKDIIRRWMIACTPFGTYQNGDQVGEMTRDRLVDLAAKAKIYPGDVAIYLIVGEGWTPGHIFDLDTAGPADGWGENFKIDPKTGNLLVYAKLHGEAAHYVDEDYVRYLSIGTIEGFNPDGSSRGEVLQHIVLTNEAFDKRTSTTVAASRYKGGEGAVSYFTTALPKKEAAMAEDPKDPDMKKKLEEMEATIAKLQSESEKKDKDLAEMKTLLEEKMTANAELAAANRNLKGDVEKFKTNPKLTEAVETIKSQERQLLAGKVRRLVTKGVQAGQFNLSLVGEPEAGYDHQSDEVVLTWFTTSPFKGSIEKLEFALDTYPKTEFSRRHRTGSPRDGDGSEVSFSSEDRKFLRKHGMTDKAAAAAFKARNLTEFREAMADIKEK